MKRGTDGVQHVPAGGVASIRVYADDCSESDALHTPKLTRELVLLKNTYAGISIRTKTTGGEASFNTKREIRRSKFGPVAELCRSLEARSAAVKSLTTKASTYCARILCSLRRCSLPTKDTLKLRP